ncbi:MAG: flagellar hook-basal body complex protein FliE [Pseudobdellovibrionaceae bacterium]
MDGLTVRTNSNLASELTDRLGRSSRSQSNSIDGQGFEQIRNNEPTAASFSDTLATAMGKVNELQKSSDKAAQNLATGRTDNIADVMIASEKADIALKVMVQVRNKIIDAYQEIMKMQV